MKATPLPALIRHPEKGIVLEAYSSANQIDLWNSILSDREHPKRKGIWPGHQSFEALKSYMQACDLGSSRKGRLRIEGDLSQRRCVRGLRRLHQDLREDFGRWCGAFCRLKRSLLG